MGMFPEFCVGAQSRGSDPADIDDGAIGGQVAY
jgi:hypothetical protein